MHFSRTERGHCINLSARHTNSLKVSCQTSCFFHIHKQYRKSNVTCYWRKLLNAHLLNLLLSFTNSLRAAPASSLPHHCKHEFSAHSLSKRPPRASGQSQYRSSPGWCADTSPILHESRGSAQQRPIAALWVKGYCWSVRGGVFGRDGRAKQLTTSRCLKQGLSAKDRSQARFKNQNEARRCKGQLLKPSRRLRDSWHLL